ncbi:MAG: DUF4384 domain-containing protein [Treponema sp.]|jgi:hypothetical protein|nr:DUF4384 domain-containing protein [Treponema sp.]
MKKQLVMIALCLAALGSLGAQNTGFTWDLRLEKKSNGTALDFNQTIEILGAQELADAPEDLISHAVAQGDGLSLRMSSRTNTYCYVIQYGQDRKVTILNDTEIKAGAAQVFSLSLSAASGTDTFYIIMSLKKEDKLDNYIKAYKRSPASRQSHSNVYYEVLAIQKADDPLGEPPQKFTISGGTARGAPETAALDAPPAGTARYAGRNHYVRIISVKY